MTPGIQRSLTEAAPKERITYTRWVGQLPLFYFVRAQSRGSAKHMRSPTKNVASSRRGLNPATPALDVELCERLLHYYHRCRVVFRKQVLLGHRLLSPLDSFLNGIFVNLRDAQSHVGENRDSVV